MTIELALTLAVVLLPAVALYSGVRLGLPGYGSDQPFHRLWTPVLVISAFGAATALVVLLMRPEAAVVDAFWVVFGWLAFAIKWSLLAIGGAVILLAIALSLMLLRAVVATRGDRIRPRRGA